MPNMDGTGPNGQGPKTGRGLGKCGGGAGRGRGRRNGYDFGSRRFSSNENELASLELMEKDLKEELSAISERKVSLNNQKK